MHQPQNRRFAYIFCWERWEVIKIFLKVTYHQYCWNFERYPLKRTLYTTRSSSSCNNQRSATTLWLLFCSFCVNRPWREYSRHLTGYHKTVKILSLLDRYWHQVSKIVITRIVPMSSFFVTTHMNEITQYALTSWSLAINTFGLEPNSHKKKNKGSALTGSWTMTVSHVSHSIKTSGRKGEKMYTVTNSRYFRRHGCPCEDLWRWPHCLEQCNCHDGTLRAWSELFQSAGHCQSVRLHVWSELDVRQAEDEDEVVQVQDDCFHLAEFTVSSPFFKVFWFLASWILSSLAFNFLGWPSTVITEGHLKNCHKNGKVPGQICWSYPKISLLELQDSSGLTNILISRCNHGIVDVLWVSITLSSSLAQQDFNTFGVRAVLSLSFLVTLCSLTRIAPEVSHNSGSRWFCPWESGHEATIKITCWAKMSKMIIGIIINFKSAFKWVFQMDLTLHLPEHKGNWKVVQVLVRLLFVISVCCRIGISNNDINLVVLYLLKYCSKKLSDSSRCSHRLLVVEIAYTTSWSLKTWSGHLLPLLCLEYTLP